MTENRFFSTPEVGLANIGAGALALRSTPFVFDRDERGHPPGTLMENEGLLIGIAEVSIALTGFAGVVVVLGRRASGPWPLAEQFQLRSLVENGLLVVLAALLPFAVSQHTEEPSVIWRVSSGIFGAVAGFHAFVIQACRQRQLRRGSEQSSGPLIPTALVAVLVPVSVVVHGALVLNAAGVMFDGSFTPYLYGLLWDLSMGAMFFARLIRFT